MERVAEEGARPGEGEDAEMSVVEAGGEIRVAGDGWWLRRKIVVAIGGGRTEARREGGGVRHFLCFGFCW